MKKLFFILALTAGSFAANAQNESADVKPFHISLGVDAGLPVGDWSDFYSFAIGGSLKGAYSVADELAITLSAGYLNLSGKTFSGVKVPSTGLIPVLAGIKYNFTPKVFATAELGSSFGTEKGSGSIFTYAPGIGFNLSDHIDANVRYIGFSEKGGVSSSLIGLRLAYTF